MTDKTETAWLRFDAAWLRDEAESIPKPWPRILARMDLRYWENALRMGWVSRIPNKSKLCQRWGWGEKKARLLMKNEQEWKKPDLRQTKARSTPALSQLLSAQIPVDIEVPKNEASFTPALSQTEARKRATRAELKNKQQRTKNKESNKRPKGLCQVSELDAVWSEINRIKGGRSLKLTKSRATALQARIKESSSDDVLAVVKWRESSTHKRATLLRDGGFGIDTLLRAGKFQMYLEMSDEMSTVKQPKTGKGSLEGNLMNHFFANIDSQIIDVTPTKQRIE